MSVFVPFSFALSALVFYVYDAHTQNPKTKHKQIIITNIAITKSIIDDSFSEINQSLTASVVLGAVSIEPAFSFVGEFVSPSIGLAVGNCVGIEVDGERLGTTDGNAVGVIDGTNVGTTVISTQQ